MASSLPAPVAALRFLRCSAALELSRRTRDLVKCLASPRTAVTGGFVIIAQSRRGLQVTLSLCALTASPAPVDAVYISRRRGMLRVITVDDL